MGYQFQFDKVLDLKEHEKNTFRTVYEESVQHFEQTAQKLYTSLKRKEDLEGNHVSKLSAGLSIEEMRLQDSFMKKMDQTIDHYQQLVIQAREMMEKAEQEFLERNVEVKKYLKMKEKDYSLYLESQKRHENNQMDEISMTQYVNRGSQV